MVQQEVTEKEERIYECGSRAAYSNIIRQCRRNLDFHDDLSRLETEREDVIHLLRGICDEFGDNDWDEDLHLADVLEKHLFNYVLDR